jgi:hypothetical protein
LTHKWVPQDRPKARRPFLIRTNHPWLIHILLTTHTKYGYPLTNLQHSLLTTQPRYLTPPDAPSPPSVISAVRCPAICSVRDNLGHSALCNSTWLFSNIPSRLVRNPLSIDRTWCRADCNSGASTARRITTGGIGGGDLDRSCNRRATSADTAAPRASSSMVLCFCASRSALNSAST